MKKFNKQNGFTLVEALVAISILMIAIASPMALAQKGLSTATQTKDQMIAAFLAQDAIEAVKNIRDQIAMSQISGDWIDLPIFSSCICTTPASCDFDSLGKKTCNIETTKKWDAPNVIKLNNGFEELKMSFDIDQNGVKHFVKYDYNPDSLSLCNAGSTNKCSEKSKFFRYLNIMKSTTNPNEALVKVRVSWTSSQGAQKIDIQDFMYNYSENL